jgi:hypothetical protein
MKKIVYFIFIFTSILLLIGFFYKIETNYYCCESATVRWKFALYCGECDSETSCHFIKLENTGLLEYFGFRSLDCKLNPKEKVESTSNRDKLFKLKEIISENFIRIIPPKNSEFEFPDSSAKIEPHKKGDFNADGKEDILVYLGGCGTGGCIYGLFLNQYDDFYKLAFMDYLKNAEFKVEKNGMWIIESSEELEPYNPSKIQISTFRFDKTRYKYEMDTLFVSYDK